MQELLENLPTRQIEDPCQKLQAREATENEVWGSASIKQNRLFQSTDKGKWLCTKIALKQTS